MESERMKQKSECKPTDTPGGAGQTEAHSWSLSQLSSLSDNDIIHLRLRGDESDGKIPESARHTLHS